MKEGRYINRKDGRIVKFSAQMIEHLSKTMGKDWKSLTEPDEPIEIKAVKVVPFELAEYKEVKPIEHPERIVKPKPIKSDPVKKQTDRRKRQPK